MANNNNNKTTGVGHGSCRRWWIGSRSTPPFYTTACIAAASASASLPAGSDRWWSLDDIIGPYPLAGSVDLQSVAGLDEESRYFITIVWPALSSSLCVSSILDAWPQTNIESLCDWIAVSLSLCFATVNFIRRGTWQTNKMIKSRGATRLSLSRIK